MNLYFDTETTGLFGKLNWETEYKEFPYIVELSWMMGNKPIRHVIHQEGRKIPKEATAIHGITDKIAATEGKTLKYVLELFIADAQVADKVIAHNIYYDTSMIKAETLRAFGKASNKSTEVVDALHKDKRVDTMMIGNRYMKRGKWPTLQELHKHLFGCEFDGAHSAAADILAMKKCYLELCKRGAE